MSSYNRFPVMSAAEAADLILDGSMVAIGGFSPAGAPKAVPKALAERAISLHQAGHPFQVRLLSGASISASSEDLLAESGAVSWRAPYQTSGIMRKMINAGKIDFTDMHLSEIAQMVDYGFFGELDFAIIEASAIDNSGRITLTTGIGAAPTFAAKAKKIIVELNAYHSPRLEEITDIAFLSAPPDRTPVPVCHPMDRIGCGYLTVPPEKIAAVVETNSPDEIGAFAECNDTDRKIAANLVEFLLNELGTGRIPKTFLPIQSGVGNINNAVLKALGEHPDFPVFSMYTEVFQDSAAELMDKGKISGISASSLTVAPATLERIYANFDFYKSKIVLRPQELSNNPEVIRRLGVIALNVALEADIYGNANSTHLFGQNIMNGIGGSGDFERNAYLSVFMLPSTAKQGCISSIVPMCTHLDHSEHSVKVIVTEYGVADLRGLSPRAKAREIIEKCAAPEYRVYLHSYLNSASGGHIGHDLSKTFELHRNYLQTGKMLS